MIVQPAVGSVIAAPVEIETIPEDHKDWHQDLHEHAAVVAAEEIKENVEKVKHNLMRVYHIKFQKVDEAVQDSRSNSTSSVATTLEDLPSSRRLTNDVSGVTLVSNYRRQSIEVS